MEYLSASLDPELTTYVDKDEATVKTDGWKTYESLADRTGLEHEMVKLDDGTPAHDVFPWIHIVWGDLKRGIGGVHTKASKDQLQGCLDLFAYRFNHRDDLAERLDRGERGRISPKPLTREDCKAGLAGVVY